MAAMIRSITILELQEKLWEWQDKNFGVTGPPRHMFLGMCEEAGELVHSILKYSQGIRGTDKEHITNMKDAIGDIMVYLINFYHRGKMGCVDIKNVHLEKGEKIYKTTIQLELLGWSVYRSVTQLGLYFEPSFTNNEEVPEQYHTHIRECTDILCHELSYLCNLLGTSLYDCINDVWTNVLSKRDWKANPMNGVV